MPASHASAKKPYTTHVASRNSRELEDVTASTARPRSLKVVVEYCHVSCA